MCGSRKPVSPTSPSPEALIARYRGDPVRHSERETVAPARWKQRRPGPEPTGWGVGALVEADERVLLVREEGHWLFPGGALKPGERPVEGAAREVEEETGVPVEVTTLLAVTERTVVNAADGRTFAFAFATFQGRPTTTTVSADPGLPGEGIDRAAWHATLPTNTFDYELVARLRE
jgi:ADP-ribose pyrophosphatase YjhB (NUDIX family)